MRILVEKSRSVAPLASSNAMSENSTSVAAIEQLIHFRNELQ